ncbi:MAG: DUF6233 domain-containing protein [Streptomyces sp.]
MSGSSCGTWTRTRSGIAAEERREAKRIRGKQAHPPAPDWLSEQGLAGRAPVYVHRGHCHMTGKHSRGVTRDHARQALHEQVDACPHCRPDRELSILD